MFKNIDITISLLILVVCGVLCWQIVDFPPPLLKNTPAPSYFPKILVGGLVLLSVILIVQSLFKQDKLLHKFIWNRHVFFAMGLTLAYVFIVPFSGYFLATTLFFALLIIILGNPGWFSLITTTVVFVFFVYTLFYKILSIPLPYGKIFELWMK